MLYVFFGTDIQQSREKSRALVDSLRAKRTQATYVEMDGDTWSSSLMSEHIGGQGLFSQKYIIYLNRVLEHPDAKDELVEYVQAMHDSQNIFILLETKIPAEVKKAFETYADKSIEHEEKKSSRVPTISSSTQEFNIFALADAVGTRSAFKSWSLYRHAIESGIEIESIIGTLFWQIKSMIIARGATNAVGAGLSPFVFTKAKKAAANYTIEELYSLANDLIIMYHDGHRGVIDTELAIEKRLLLLIKKDI